MKNIFKETPTIKELTKWIKESGLDIKNGLIQVD